MSSISGKKPEKCAFSEANKLCAKIKCPTY